MSVVVFSGPTLSASEVRAELGAVVEGPVAFGDVIRVAQDRPRAIVIIDGYFERVPSVWHKEILWAMAEGTHVFGASSMGALRAAELADFGMIGVGAVFEWFRSGELEDDDEVAVVHGAAADGFPSLSEALVNMRATFRAALAEGVIDEESAAVLVSTAKKCFYADRTYPAILQAAGTAGVAPAAIGALRDWLPKGRVDQKANDARALLRHVREWLAAEPRPMRVEYRFEPTDAWHEACRNALASRRSAAVETAPAEHALIEELKVSAAFPSMRDGAGARAAAIDLARRAGFQPDDVALRDAVDRLRAAHGLQTRADFERWRASLDFDAAGFTRFLEDEARLAWSAPLCEHMSRAVLADHLRALGVYGTFARRAEEKRAVGEDDGTFPYDEEELWRWYFTERLERPRPADLRAFARTLGFSDEDELRSAVLRDRRYHQLGPRNATSARCVDTHAQDSLAPGDLRAARGDQRP